MFRYYPAFIHKESDSDYGVSFPDFLGCVSAGLTHTEALVLAKEALALHIEGMLEDGDPLPEPTPCDELLNDEFKGDGEVLLTLIEAAVPGPSRRVNITVEQSLLYKIDAAAAALGTNRSAFLCEAARAKCDQIFERRLVAAMRYEKPFEALKRLIAEDEKSTLKERHPPDINKIGVSDFERMSEKARSS